MGCQRLIVLTATLLLTKDYAVSAQYATVMECFPQSTANIAKSIVQPAGQVILPTIIQPIIPGYDSYAPDPPFGYPYGNSPAPFAGYPPIIVKDDKDDLLRNILFLMIFSMGNRNNNNFPSFCGCSSCSGKCQCCCNCPNYNKQDANSDSSSSAPVYIPVPIAIPVYTGADGLRYIDGFCDDILFQESSGQYSSNYCCGKDTNEITLIIKAE